MPQFAGRPRPAEPGSLGDLLELLPHVPAVQRHSILAAEHEIVFWPQLPRREPFGAPAGAVARSAWAARVGSFRTRRLRRVEHLGLIAREPNPADARSAMICLLAAGRRAIEDAAPQHVHNVRRHFIDLRPDAAAAG